MFADANTVRSLESLDFLKPAMNFEDDEEHEGKHVEAVALRKRMLQTTSERVSKDDG